MPRGYTISSLIISIVWAGPFWENTYKPFISYKEIHLVSPQIENVYSELVKRENLLSLIN